MEIENMPISLEEYGHTLLHEINSLIKEGEIPLIYSNRHNHELYPEHISELANIKRFLELWCADASLRESVLCGNHTMEYFNINPQEIRTLWDENAPLIMPPMSVLRYKAFNLEKVTHRNKMRANDSTSSTLYNNWRTKQMNRTSFQLRPLIASSIVHAPFCIELSQGCSVGCWFCGISAPKLGDLFLYTSENAQLFKDVIHSLKNLLGDAVKKGFCYWATDPLDNPDYESFLVDFHSITGEFPQTTTALPLKNIERTRSLLKTSQLLGGKLDRFSLLSLKQLHQVHQEFTAEELLFVELITQNKEAYSAKSNAGRAMTGAEKRIPYSKPNEQGNKVANGTIACVSGFLISMVEKSIKLISPCEANEKWPLGYIVFAEESFQDGKEFDAIIKKMVRNQMVTELRPKDKISFHNDSLFKLTEDGFTIESNHVQKSFSSTLLLRELGILINQGINTRQHIENILTTKFEYPLEEVAFFINTIANEGLLKEQPEYE